MRARMRASRPVGVLLCTDWIAEGFTPYDLRHSCASLMIAAGRPIAEVADHLGHGVDACART